MKKLHRMFILFLTLTISLVMLAADQRALAFAAEVERGPSLDVIYLDVKSSQDVGIGDVAAGRTDVFLWPASEAVYKRMPLGTIQSLKLIKTASGFWSLVFNPVQDDPTKPGVVTTTLGAVHFNPFAIKGVRYQMNWLLNRKYIIEEILAGGGAPMYSSLQPSEPANRFVESLYPVLALTPEGSEATALTVIEAALNNTASVLSSFGYTLYKKTDTNAPAGFWWTFAPPSAPEESVTVNFYIRIEDERHEEGLHIADLIEKAGIKVNRLERDRATSLLAVYYSDPKQYQWNIYTEGFVAMSEWLYPEWNIAQMYAPWYTFMPGWGEISWWQYQNSTIDDVTRTLAYGPVASTDEYWNLTANAIKMGIQESVRVFVAETWQYFPVNSRVTNIAYGTVSGLWPAWPLRTATTPDRALRATEFSAAGVLFMSPWNIIGGFQDVYSELVWRYIRDYADYPHPQTGEPIPVRTTQSVTLGNVDIPNSAIVYDPAADSWTTVGSGKKAVAKVILNYALSNWHHGKMMTMADILMGWGFSWEWSTEDYPGDPYYSSRFASQYAPTLQQIGGIEILNNTAIAIYGNYTHPTSTAVTADFYASYSNAWQWPTIPWEVLAAMEYVVVNNGPVSGQAYGWYETGGVEWIDMIVPAHVRDIKQAMGILKTADFVPNYAKIPGYTPSVGEVQERYAAAIDWANAHNHVAISNGPYYLHRYDPSIMYMELRAFRDSTYPFGPSYWQAKLFLSKMLISRVNVPTEIRIGESVTVSVYPMLKVEFPAPTEEPASSGYVEVALKDSSGAVVYSRSADFVLPGLFSVTIPSNVTQEFSAGIYSLVVSAAIEKGLYPEVSTLPIRFTKPAYSLTIGVFPFGAGQTSPGVGVTTYEMGTNETVTAIPSEGYKFSYWMLDGVPYSSEITITVTMSQAHKLAAYFSLSPVPTIMTLEMLSVILSAIALAVVAVTITFFVILPRRLRG